MWSYATSLLIHKLGNEVCRYATSTLLECGKGNAYHVGLRFAMVSRGRSSIVGSPVRGRSTRSEVRGKSFRGHLGKF